MSTKQWVMLRNNTKEEEIKELIQKVLDGESIKEETENDGNE